MINRIVPRFLHAFDRYLLRRFPRLWLTRFHFLLLPVVILSALAGLAGYFSPRSLSNLPDPATPGLLMFFVSGGMVVYWYWVQVRDRGSVSVVLRTDAWFVFIVRMLCLAVVFSIPFITVVATEKGTARVLDREAFLRDLAGLELEVSRPDSLRAYRIPPLYFGIDSRPFRDWGRGFTVLISSIDEIALPRSASASKEPWLNYMDTAIPRDVVDKSTLFQLIKSGLLEELGSNHVASQLVSRGVSPKLYVDRIIGRLYNSLLLPDHVKGCLPQGFMENALHALIMRNALAEVTLLDDELSEKHKDIRWLKSVQLDLNSSIYISEIERYVMFDSLRSTSTEVVLSDLVHSEDIRRLVDIELQGLVGAGQPEDVSILNMLSIEAREIYKKQGERERYYEATWDARRNMRRMAVAHDLGVFKSEADYFLESSQKVVLPIAMYLAMSAGIIATLGLRYIAGSLILLVVVGLISGALNWLGFAPVAMALISAVVFGNGYIRTGKGPRQIRLAYSVLYMVFPILLSQLIHVMLQAKHNWESIVGGGAIVFIGDLWTEISDFQVWLDNSVIVAIVLLLVSPLIIKVQNHFRAFPS